MYIIRLLIVDLVFLKKILTENSHKKQLTENSL